MSIKAAGYVLNVASDRRDLLLDETEHGGSFYSSTPYIAEPVPAFAHSRRAPLVVFASFEYEKITHIADGKRGASAGTGLSRLNMQDLTALARPIGFSELVDGVPKRVQAHLKRVLAIGGILPPKTLGAFVDRIVDLDSSIAGRLARYSERRRKALALLEPRAKENLAFQKETLGIALEISGIAKDDLLEWQPAAGSQQSFLDGLPGAQVREDAMLLADFSTMPGFEAIGETTHYGSKVFKKEQDPSVRLTVIMANRLPLEQQTGADLIYFNEAYKSFVMVQYKAMEKGNDQAEFRWQAGDQFVQEIARMEELLAELSKIRSGNDPDGYRFSENPFFLKFCPRVVFNPDDKGLFKGIYLPLELWKRANAAGRLKGPKGGNVLSFQNVGRRINNTEFVNLVSGSWVGTSIEQSAILGPLIREILASGKTVTFAIKHAVPETDAELEGTE
ncbi:MAG: hypothetical protein HN403_04260 [Rhodospirillales bacterium]|jgi:hypothetical protein|nr:hypothetical protein [Rhodospirillales bacterium]